MLLLAFGIAGAVGLAVSGFVADRYPRRSTARDRGGAALGLTVLAAAGAGAGVVVAAVGVWGLLLGLHPPLLQNAVIGAASPAYKVAAGAILVAMFNLGIAAGAAAGGLVIDTPGCAGSCPQPWWPRRSPPSAWVG